VDHFGAGRCAGAARRQTTDRCFASVTESGRAACQLVAELVGGAASRPSGAGGVATPDATGADDEFGLVRGIQDPRGVELAFIGKIRGYAKVGRTLRTDHGGVEGVGDATAGGAVGVAGAPGGGIALPNGDVDVGLFDQLGRRLVDGVVSAVATGDV